MISTNKILPEFLVFILKPLKHWETVQGNEITQGQDKTAEQKGNFEASLGIHTCVKTHPLLQ